MHVCQFTLPTEESFLTTGLPFLFVALIPSFPVLSALRKNSL